MEKVRRAPVNMAICLGNLKEGNLGNKKTMGRWSGYEAKGAASEQQIRYEAVCEWPGKMKCDVDKKTRKIEKNKIRKERELEGRINPCPQ